MDSLLLVALVACLWSTSMVAVLAVFSAARRSDGAKDRDLAEAVRVRDLGLPALPPLTSRSAERVPAETHLRPDFA
jgi:hypothetical protein